MNRARTLVCAAALCGLAAVASACGRLGFELMVVPDDAGGPDSADVPGSGGRDTMSLPGDDAMMPPDGTGGSGNDSGADARSIDGEVEGGTFVDAATTLGRTGCADGEREGFVNLTTHPNIAGCAGAWRIAGLREPASACGLSAGDDGSNTTGTGCSSADLCAAGWHVCRTSAEVAARAPNGCSDLLPLTSVGELFFATGQSGLGAARCEANGTNDLVGCGNVGTTVEASCAPLTRGSNNLCKSLPMEWNCPSSQSSEELLTVTKTNAPGGGVLCCRD